MRRSRFGPPPCSWLKGASRTHSMLVRGHLYTISQPPGRLPTSTRWRSAYSLAPASQNSVAKRHQQPSRTANSTWCCS
jgi:hypothetical protein